MTRPAIVIAALLLGTSARAKASDCPPSPAPAVTTVATKGRLVVVVVPDESPLIARTLLRPDRIEVFPVLSATTAQDAAELFANGKLTCGATISVSAESIRSPVDGSSIFESVILPTLAPEPGHPDPGSEVAARIGRSHDTITWKDPPYLPVRQEAPVVVAVAGGAALSIRLTSSAYGVVGHVFGPVLRLNARGEPPPKPVEVAYEDVPFWMSQDAAVRVALDDRSGTLTPADRIRATRAGYGGIDRRVSMPDLKLHDPGGDFSRIAFAYGTAFFVPWVSSAFSLLTKPKCLVYCNDLGMPGDKAFSARFQRRSLASIERSRSRLTAFELAAVGTAMLTTLIPSNRRGALSRVEILEDALIIGEAVSVSWTTPLFLQARVGRRRPVSFHPGYDLGPDGRDAIAPAFVALRSNRAAVLLGASTMLLVMEDAGLGWVLTASTILAGLVAGVAYYEVDSGLVFPWDIPLGIFDGIVNGMGVVAYHRIFWRGWPSDERGGLPLRLQGVHINALPGGGALSVAAGF